MRLIRARMGVLILMAIAFNPANVCPEEDWVRPKVGDFGFDRFRQSVGSVDQRLQGLTAFTELLAKNCDNPGIQGHGSFGVYELPAEKEIHFRLRGTDLHKFSTLLNWDFQHIGFPNMVTVLRGYGLVSQTKLLELGLENLKLKGAPSDELIKAQAALDEMQKQLADFLSHTQWVD